MTITDLATGPKALEFVPQPSITPRRVPAKIQGSDKFFFGEHPWTFDGSFNLPSEMPHDFCVFDFGNGEFSLRVKDNHWQLLFDGTNFISSTFNAVELHGKPIHFELNRGHDGLSLLINGILSARSLLHMSVFFGSNKELTVGGYSNDEGVILPMIDFRITKGVQRHPTKNACIGDRVFMPAGVDEVPE